MAKKRSTFNIQKRKSRTGKISYLAFVVASGSGSDRKRLTKSFDTIANAKAWIESTRVKIRNKEVILSPSLSVGEFLNHWLDNKNIYRKGSCLHTPKT